jgi:photosynthetic reaction center cytochrome c subunit
MIKRVQLLTLLLIITVLSAAGLSAGSAEEDSNLLSAESVPAQHFSTAQDKPSQPVKTAEQVYKNIQLFKGMPASQLDAVMAFISGSLGVRCNHCHVNPFDKDDKPAKQTARRMIQMVFDLNKGSFNGQGAVTCFTCHRGQTRPVSVPSLGHNLWQPSGAATQKDAPLPSIEQVLERYVQAVGGRQAVEKVTSRVSKGSRVGADGVLVPEEVYAKAPNKLLVTTTYPKLVFHTGFNGTRGWAKSNREVREPDAEMLAQLKLEAEFYKEIKLKEMYSKMEVVGKATVGEREAYVVEAAPAGGGNPERLYFDTQTGLLLRKYSESKIVLGQFPTQTDYEDYREVDGIKLPFTIRWAIPGRVWGRKLTEVKQNVPLDDAQFNPPVVSGK